MITWGGLISPIAQSSQPSPPEPAWTITWGGLCLLFSAATLAAALVYVFSRRNRRRPIRGRRTAFDPAAFREQLVEQIVRDAGGAPPASREQPANDDRPRVPK